MMARVRATLRNALGWLKDLLHESYCPCGGAISEWEPDSDTVPVRLSEGAHLINGEPCGGCSFCKAGINARP
jgi:hypothetical protein